MRLPRTHCCWTYRERMRNVGYHMHYSLQGASLCVSRWRRAYAYAYALLGALCCCALMLLLAPGVQLFKSFALPLSASPLTLIFPFSRPGKKWTAILWECVDPDPDCKSAVVTRTRAQGPELNQHKQCQQTLLAKLGLRARVHIYEYGHTFCACVTWLSVMCSCICIANTNTFVHLYICLCVYVYMCICVYVYIWIFVYVYIWIFVYVYIWILVYLCIHIFVSNTGGTVSQWA